MKRPTLVVLLALIVMVLGASPALAGEVSGPPGPGGAEGQATPIADFWIGGGAASICSFSGLNDLIEPQEPTRTQSYGTFLVLVKRVFDLSAQEAMEVLGESPGLSCNPTEGPNPKGVGR